MKDYLKSREWQLRTESARADREAFEQKVRELHSATGLSEITLRVCLMRGLESEEAIRDYLSPRFDSLCHPYRIKDMEKATARLADAKRRDEYVRVFGDYDVDGTTGSALLSWVFRDFGLRYDVRQPDRFKDGYGLSAKAVEEAAQAGVQVLVTVDCGITSFEAAEKAKAFGIDLIVVDHHQLDPARGCPPAVAVINPQRADCTSGLKQLCGCGLAFYLAMALRIRWREEGWFGEAAGVREPNLKQHLDLVVMATAADMVPLVGDNRVLVRHGMEILRNSKKPGVRALLEVTGLGSKNLSPGSLGFVLGPRINASGRMQSASVALELLTTQDNSRAFQIAHELEKLNTERAEIQNRIWDQVRARVEKGISDGKFKHGIVVADREWHEGVVGIVASRVTETFRRPAAVIALREDYGKGSVRSYGGKDVLSALRASSAHLLGFGGHKHAAGLSVALDQVDALAESFDRALSEIEEDAASKPLLIEGEAEIQELNVRTLEELELLAPFGPGNPEPVFSFKAEVRTHSILKGRHLKLKLGAVGDKPQPGRPPKVLEAIWFHGAEREDILESLGETAEWAGVPELNRFRGQATPTLRVRDWRKLPL